MIKLVFITVLINFVSLSISQECNPSVVEWRPHQYSCEKYVLCFHGNPLERSCAPGLHFSPTILKCMFPIDAQCDEDYICPTIDDVNNPVFLPDRFDCQKYFVCFKGSPLARTCAEGLWFDIINNWCEKPDDVTCDDRTSNNPGNPVSTTTDGPTIVTEAPILSSCTNISHLFSPEDGLYMKSSCIVYSNVNYGQAEEICLQNNMNLFVIESSALEVRLQATTTDSLSQYNNGFVWINGRRDESLDEWFSFTHLQRPIYAGLTWVQTEEIDGRTTGDCLRFSQEHGPYEAKGESCDSQSYVICELFEQPELNTDICQHETELKDDEGNYLKTSCIVNTLDTYTVAEKRCIDHGMTLFVINNSTVQTALFESTTEVLVGQPNGFLWINGKTDPETQDWFVHGHAREPLYEGIDWVETESIDGRTSGDCLRFSSQVGPYRARGDDCSIVSWIICEY